MEQLREFPLFPPLFIIILEVLTNAIREAKSAREEELKKK